MSQLMRFPNAVKREPAIDVWMEKHPGPLGAIARRWFDAMRACGNDVRELLHDGHPTACVADAAFGYVNVFKAHVNVGFFRGAEIPDPNRILVGTGTFMRHVKLMPESEVSAAALKELIETAYTDIKRRDAAESQELPQNLPADLAGSARVEHLVLFTRNIRVSAGAHILDDWLIFSISDLGAKSRLRPWFELDLFEGRDARPVPNRAYLLRPANQIFVSTGGERLSQDNFRWLLATKEDPFAADAGNQSVKTMKIVGLHLRLGS